MKNGSGACVENFNSSTASGMTPMNERGKRKEGSEVKVMTMTTVDDDTTVRESWDDKTTIQHKILVISMHYVKGRNNERTRKVAGRSLEESVVCEFSCFIVMNDFWGE